MKRKQPQEKSSTSGKKIKMTKSITNVEQKNPTQEILLSFEYIRKENRHLNLNLIFIIIKYVSIYIRSIYFIRFFFCKHTYLQSSVTQSKRDNSSQIINYNFFFKST